MKLFSFCFNKWWILPLFSLILIGLTFIFDSIWFIILSIFFIAVSVIYQFIKNGWKSGCLAGLVMLLIISLSVLWFITQLFPSPEKIHTKYSKRYENWTEIQRIIGLKIPKFKIVNSQLKHFNNSEFEIHSKIEFNTPPEDMFYNMIDSICSLPIPKKPNKNSSFFYYGLENVYSCWTKDGNKYKYERNTDFGETFLHSTDAYFDFEVTKGEKTAKIIYGNY
jgi:hypothetical protein